MRITRSISLVAAALPFAAMAAHSPQLATGGWERVTTVTGATLGGRAIQTEVFSNSFRIRMICISAWDATHPARHFLGIGPNSKCTPGGSVANGRIELNGLCNDGQFGPSLLTGTGTYKLKSYDVNARSEGRMRGLPLVITMHVSGRYVGACDGTESNVKPLLQ